MPVKSAKALVDAANAEVGRLTVEEAKAVHEEGRARFVDVREGKEWDGGRVPGAVHAPRGLLEFIADPASPAHKEALDPDAPLVLYCAAGGRSALAAKTLKDMGYKDVRHVDGGFTAWSQAGFPVEKG
ncbi:MAG: rhodanese-like domain-containing protein [Geminicoccaceae bacterium]|nr:rhodanese-like domain-containing protein [Geminicoccaceae bacterium]